MKKPKTVQKIEDVFLTLIKIYIAFEIGRFLVGFILFLVGVKMGVGVGEFCTKFGKELMKGSSSSISHIISMMIGYLVREARDKLQSSQEEKKQDKK